MATAVLQFYRPVVVDSTITGRTRRRPLQCIKKDFAGSDTVLHKMPCRAPTAAPLWQPIHPLYHIYTSFSIGYCRYAAIIFCFLYVALCLAEIMHICSPRMHQFFYMGQEGQLAHGVVAQWQLSLYQQKDLIVYIALPYTPPISAYIAQIRRYRRRAYYATWRQHVSATTLTTSSNKQETNAQCHAKFQCN